MPERNLVGGVEALVAVLPQPALLLDRRCLNPRLATVDADRDGRVDLALLTGAPGGPDRQLHILWNDGQGFTTRSETLVSGSDPVQDFTVRDPGGDRPPGLAWVTTDSLRLVEGTATPRLLTPARGCRGAD